MVGVVDRYSHVVFAGARSEPRDWRERWLRPVREAPSSSIFAKPVARHAPVISPPDRLLLEDIFRRGQLTGIAYRPSALARRIPACLRALHVRSPTEALRRVEQEPAVVEVAINALLIGVTAFFRDPLAFGHLRNTALPDLLRVTPRPRVLSIGCSDGAELYSLAILLFESGAKEMALKGIDCRRHAIERARIGRYSTSAMLPVALSLKEKYFEPLGNGWRACDFLRNAIQWQVSDALVHIPPGPYDLITCRNFAIYLEHPSAARLWRKIHSALRPGGILLAGKAEHPTSGFVRVGPCLFRKAHP